MLIGIPFHSNKIGLAALLVNLQAQTTSDDIIYIMDNSPDHAGHAIGKLYGGSKTTTLIEVGSFSIYQSWNIFLQASKDNKQEGTLILNDDVLLSLTCINNLKRASRLTPHLALVTKTPSRAWVSDRLDPNFNWYSKVTTQSDIMDVKWMPGFAFYLKQECLTQIGTFDEKFKIWFGDTDYARRLNGFLGRLENEYIYHFGSKSFTYKSQTVLDQIALDRHYYETKHGQI